MPKDYKVKYTPTSKSDLISIIEYISDDNIDAAYDMADKIDIAIQSLSEFPYKGTIPNDSQLRLRGFKLLVVSPYIVFYKPDKNNETISIIRILSSRQDYLELL